MLVRSFITIFLLTTTTTSQHCIGKDAALVSWWVQMIFPRTVENQYAYFDSTFNDSQFQIQPQSADSASTAFYKTLDQINSLSLQYIAWNDQLPNGSTSSVKAHSKAVLAFDSAAKTGFYFGHSIPEFPNFVSGTINTTIDDSQKIYGQHAICITLNGEIVQDMINRMLPMRPYIYAQRNSVIISNTTAQPDYISLFTYKSYVNLGTNFKFIYKNGALNGSLFQDGLNQYLNSSLLVKSWGRPIQSAWCGSKTGHLNVANVQYVTFNNISNWKQTLDHSKWAYAQNSNYSCFGDANRMTSQWKRGGAFYCVESPLLHEALDNIITQNNTCGVTKGQKWLLMSLAAIPIAILMAFCA